MQGDHKDRNASDGVLNNGAKIWKRTAIGVKLGPRVEGYGKISHTTARMPKCQR